MADAKRDNNRVTTLLAVSNADGTTPVVLWADPTTHRLLVDLPAGSGTVTSVSVVSANGLAGTVATATTTPAITLTTSISGVLKGNGTAISAAVAGTDYSSGTSALATGILKSTTTTGSLSIAVAADFPTLNQNTTGTAAGLSAVLVPASGGTGVANANASTLAISGAFATTLTISGVTALTLPTSGTVTALGNTTTGTGSIVLATSPTLTTAVLGSSTATTQTPGDNSTKLATTAYVDAAVLGQNFKEAAKWATTAALPANTYNNGAAGVGATLTAVATGVLTIDGNTVALNDRVLVKNEVTGANNGIYFCTVAGAIGVAYVLTRATGANQSVEWKTGDSIFITSGSTLSTTTWAYTGIDSPTIGTTALTFAQVAGQGSFTAGNGITITGTSIAVDLAVVVDKTTAQTLTNKTLTTPIIASISNTGILTLPTSTDTLVGRATTDTLTNKTLGNTNTVTLKQSLFTLQDATDTTKQLTFALSGITTATTRTITMPDASGTVTLLGNTSTGSGSVVLATSPTLTTPNIGAATATSLTAAVNTSINMIAGTYNTIQTYTPAAAGTATLDLSKGNIHHITMPAGNITIAISNGTAGQCFIVRILQDATGSRTVTWFTTIKWAGGTAPTLTTTASKADTMGFEITGTNTYDGFVVGANI